MNQPANPKKLYGDKKPPLSYFPLVAILAGLEALYDGRLKYGPYNWRDEPVEAMTYVDAALRHLELYANGEDVTRDTAVKNLGAVIACCAILLDAEAEGSLIDNRRISEAACLVMEAAENWVKTIRERYEPASPTKLTTPAQDGFLSQHAICMDVVSPIDVAVAGHWEDRPDGREHWVPDFPKL